MFAGMALGGIHIANAQNNVNSEIDNSRYTVMIPSEVTIKKFVTPSYYQFVNVILSLTVLVPTHCMSFVKEVVS